MEKRRSDVGFIRVQTTSCRKKFGIQDTEKPFSKQKRA